jgi:hypothetical protein
MGIRVMGGYRPRLARPFLGLLWGFFLAAFFSHGLPSPFDVHNKDDNAFGQGKTEIHEV